MLFHLFFWERKRGRGIAVKKCNPICIPVPRNRKMTDHYKWSISYSWMTFYFPIHIGIDNYNEWQLFIVQWQTKCIVRSRTGKCEKFCFEQVRNSQPDFKGTSLQADNWAAGRYNLSHPPDLSFSLKVNQSHNVFYS